MTYVLIGVAALSALAFLAWRLIAIGCEEPLINQRKAKWFQQ